MNHHSLEQLGELRDRKLLGALCRFGNGGQQRAIVAPRQIVANCFPLVAKTQAHKAQERLAIQGAELGFGAGVNRTTAESTLGGGRNAPAGTVKSSSGALEVASARSNSRNRAIPGCAVNRSATSFCTRNTA